MFRVRLIGPFAHEAWIESRTKFGASVLLIFVGEATENLFEKGHCPAAFVILFRCRGVGGFVTVTGLGCVELQGNQGGATASFLRLGPVAFVCEKVVHHSEHEGTKPSAVGVCSGEGMAFQQMREKSLCSNPARHARSNQ